MPGITLEQAQSQLDKYLQAEEKVLTGQAYEIAGRSLTRADLKAIIAGIDTWDRRVKELSNKLSSPRRSKTISPGW